MFLCTEREKEKEKEKKELGKNHKLGLKLMLPKVLQAQFPQSLKLSFTLYLQKS